MKLQFIIAGVIAAVLAQFWGNITPNLIDLGINLNYIEIGGKFLQSVTSGFALIAGLLHVVIPTQPTQPAPPVA